MRGGVVVLCLAALVGGATTHRPARAAAVAPEIYAIVIGYNGGRPGLPDLRYADDDAVRFSMFFSGLIPAGQPGRVWLLTDIDSDTRRTLGQAGLSVPPANAPTRAAVQAAFAEVARTLAVRPRGADRVLYVVYAGHGLHGKILLRPDAAPEAAMTGPELRAALAGVVAADPGVRPFLFVDACRSESLFGQRGDGSDQGPDLGAAIRDLEQRAQAVKLGILTAAQTGKPAGEVRSLEAGYFSHVLTSGLAGAADADGDEIVTFGELAAFVAFNTQKLTGQQPWFEPPGGDLGAHAIDHRGHVPRLLISGPEVGRYLVGAGAGLPVFVEAFKDPARPLRLALPPGRYRVVRASGANGRHGAVVDLQAGQSLELASAAWTDLPARAADRGETDPANLGFSAPFSSDVVSTLAAGYHAGREPSSPLGDIRHLVRLSAGVGPAPLGLRGAESSLALGYRFRPAIRWPFFVGAVGRAATSAHQADGDAYDLRHLGAQIESGAAHEIYNRVTISAAVGGGVASLWRRQGTTNRGDRLVPLLTASIGVDVRISERLSIGGDLRYVGRWVQIDGRRQRSGEPVVDLGVGWCF